MRQMQLSWADNRCMYEADSTDEPFAERRIGRRLPALGLPLGRLLWNSGHASTWAPCCLLDVSVTGCSLLTAPGLALRPGLRLGLQLSEPALDCTIEVRRVLMHDVGGPDAFGAEFIGDVSDAVELFGAVSDVLQGRSGWRWQPVAPTPRRKALR